MIERFEGLLTCQNEANFTKSFSGVRIWAKLMALGGQYAYLFSLQAEGYR